MELQGENDIQKAIFLLREIEAFLSFNIQPPKEQMYEMKKTIEEFIQHFPHCWECGDTGFTGNCDDFKCKCNKS